MYTGTCTYGYICAEMVSWGQIKLDKVKLGQIIRPNFILDLISYLVLLHVNNNDQILLAMG